MEDLHLITRSHQDAGRDASVIMLEFNELTPSLMARFMSQGKLPNFQRLYDESHIHITDAEESGEWLNPWVQWVTVHTGLAADEHNVLRLADGCRLEKPATWDMLSDAGYRVWICGSMNARMDRPLNGLLIPDPWSSGLAPYPEGKFDDYYYFIRDMVQEHSNESSSNKTSSASKFALFMIQHGLSFPTAFAIAKQLISERFGENKWRRASIMDRLHWDVFRHFYRKISPHFSTFFINSTAHYQHMYWRNMDPDGFDVKPNQDEQNVYKDAILFGYQAMDKLIARFMHLAGPNTTLVFCTGLSQQPYLAGEEYGGKRLFRIKDPKFFADRLNITGEFEYDPVMSQEFFLRFTTPAQAKRAHQTLLNYRLQGEKAFNSSLDGNNVFASCRYRKPVEEDALLTSVDGSFSDRFLDIFYPIAGLKSGFHHPDGMLWIRYPNREHVIHEDKVPIRSINEAILNMFGASMPSPVIAEN